MVIHNPKFPTIIKIIPRKEINILNILWVNSVIGSKYIIIIKPMTIIIILISVQFAPNFLITIMIIYMIIDVLRINNDEMFNL